MKKITVSQDLVEYLFTDGSVHNCTVSSEIPKNSRLVSVNFIPHKFIVELVFDIGDSNMIIENSPASAQHNLSSSKSSNSSKSDPSDPKDAYDRAMKPFSG